MFDWIFLLWVVLCVTQMQLDTTVLNRIILVAQHVVEYEGPKVSLLLRVACTRI